VVIPFLIKESGATIASFPLTIFMKKLIIKILILLAILTIHQMLFTREVLAICPVCTVAVGAGLGISRALGIDDAVTSVWIGGLVLSMSYWLTDWLMKKRYNFVKKINPEYLDLIVIVLMYVITLVPLWYGKYIGRENNTFWGTDKILLGTAVGSVAFISGKWLDKKVRETKGKQLFVYQKVVFPVASLLIASMALHFLVS